MGLTFSTSGILGPLLSVAPKPRKIRRNRRSLSPALFSLFSPCTDGAVSLSGLQVHILSEGPSTGLRCLACRAAFISNQSFEGCSGWRMTREQGIPWHVGPLGLHRQRRVWFLQTYPKVTPQNCLPVDGPGSAPQPAQPPTPPSLSFPPLG